MDRYQIAEKPEGPWLELAATSDPVRALAFARASFDWKVVWVAKMRLIEGADILPEREQFWADIKERLAILYGSVLIDELEVMFTTMPFEIMEVALDTSLDAYDIDVLIPEIKRPYGKDQNVRPADFKEAITPKKKPSLRELMS
jgi:hypothetical protein